MSQSKLSLSVKGYEDVDDGSNNVMTLYIVRVEEASKNVYYVLKKRYTDFSRLYTALKERFPEIESFRFPNKSIFNTNAQFTKDRRRQGFDDFLKITTTMNPIPTELIEFLEIEQHYRDYYSRQPAVATTAAVVTTKESSNSNDDDNNTNTHNNNNNNNNNNDDDSNATTTTTSTTTTPNNNTIPEMKSYTKPNQSSTTSTPTTPTTTTTTNNNNSNNNKNDNNSNIFTIAGNPTLLNLVSSTLIYTTITYIICILLRVIDIRKTTTTKIILAIVALSSVVLFVRLQLLGLKVKSKSKTT